MGIYPELSKCIKCDNKPDESTVYFSKVAGGIVDKSCSLHFEDAQKTDKDVIKIWRYLAESEYPDLLKLHSDPKLFESASELALEYLKCLTMIDYRSIRVLS